ncbi:hotdog domain-containing protein [Micromonospora sp. HM5-17]|uniref:3-aminobutyryl-CoA ammonia lyase n=1 Tax=Micromonospora sp. HM5-17 TaxID=2487710 RepID=UPI000F4854F2|nr:hotdog domain-containing protein [Micromonospora sp. HM5-17]ROT29573.1 3-aminobutyryl-CoA ammonia-lyase [Micromonospora sp. HM5-17]
MSDRRDGGTAADPRLGLSVTHRRYVPYGHAHYAGNLIDGAYVLGLFGDVATEVCIRTDADEGLFAGYAEVRFREPVRAGDVLEVEATVTRVGNRSRTLEFACRVVCRGRPDRGPSAAEVLDPPLLAVTAVGTVVVPPATGLDAPSSSAGATRDAGPR